jgi:hypothetical protein
MKPKKRQKMCCHCEGEVDLDVIVCPHCAADLREEKPEQRLGASVVKNLHTQEDVVVPEREVPQTAVMEEKKHLLGPILLFALGAQLFLFALLMLLFSDKGQLVLKWDAKLWFVYLLSSVPLLIFGYRSISKL